MSDSSSCVLLIEPFYTGSHAQLIDYLAKILYQKNIQFHLSTLPGKKWHWRARTSALILSRNIPYDSNFTVLFCSSVLNLSELIALRPDLRVIKKVLYFHENQFVYPTQNERERDFQYGYNTILSAMVADVILFNSKYNMDSFLGGITKHLRKQPDCRVRGLDKEIEPKCRVVYFPVDVVEILRLNEQGYRNSTRYKEKGETVNIEVSSPDSPLCQLATTNNCSTTLGVSKTESYGAILMDASKQNHVLHIIWPHRWEHDKNPSLFFETLFKLKESGFNFKVSVLGESYVDPMPIFEKARNILKDNIINFGRLHSKDDYLKCLQTGDVVVSTADHEFFGVAMLEAVLSGCFPVAPRALVYPEFYPSECLYITPEQLFKKLKMFCLKPYLAGEYLKKINFNSTQFSDDLTEKYLNILMDK